ncbi:MAG: hypothetical protein JST85_17190 [Acidobacteria bacterium]|nr:hypothetical protein [Acidobacteriota bacterium]
MFGRILIRFAVSLSLLATIGCGAQLYNVTPLPASSSGGDFASGELGVIAATTILDGDQSLERFEANLPLAGVIAIDIRLANKTSAPVKTDSLKFSLRDASGGTLKQIQPEQALKRVMKYYGDGFYRKDAKLRTIESYKQIGLATNAVIPSQGNLRGFLFYETQNNRTSLGGLTFSVVGVTKQININNN